MQWINEIHCNNEEAFKFLPSIKIRMEIHFFTSKFENKMQLVACKFKRNFPSSIKLPCHICTTKYYTEMIL